MRLSWENGSFSCLKDIFCVNFKYSSAFLRIQSGAKGAFSFFVKDKVPLPRRIHMGRVFIGAKLMV